MLRACIFALTALNAVGGFSFVHGNDEIFPADPEFRASLLPVFNIEDLRNRNIHRAALRAVMTCSAGNGFVFVQRFLRFTDHFMFMFGQRFEVFHERQVVLHLFNRTHSAQHRKQVFLFRNITQCPGRIGHAGILFVKDGFYRINRIRKDASLDRLHDHNRLAVFLTDLEVLFCGDAGIVPVGVVDLKLNEFTVRMRFKNLNQKVGISMERETVMFDQSLFLQTFYIIPDAVFLILLPVRALNRMHQVVIDISGIGSLKRGFKLFFRLFLRDRTSGLNKQFGG